METLYREIKNVKQELQEIRSSLAVEVTDEDLEFMEGTWRAWKEIDEGKGITLSKKEFLEKIKSW